MISETSRRHTDERLPDETAVPVKADARSPQVVLPGEGELFEMTPSEWLIWKAVGSSTVGTPDCFELVAQPGNPGAPEHIHDVVDELYYVLAGAFRVKLGSDLILALPGTFINIPRGTRHTWVNADTVASRMLVMFVPGGMRPFFEATSPLVRAVPIDVGALAAAAERFATHVVGPPLEPELESR